MSRTQLAVTIASALSACALVGGAGVGAAVAHQPASHQPAARATAKPTTLAFTAKHAGQVIQGKTTYDLSDTDVKGTKQIGLDVLSCTDPASRTAACDVSFAYKGGTIHAHFTLTDASGALSGRITGGTGAFAKVEGTITGQAVSRSEVDLKLVYTD